MPRQGEILVADNSTLLHEMIHQYLGERGEFPKHEGEPWCREIMRLHKLIAGREIWAGKTTVVKIKDGDKDRRSVRINKPHPETGAASLPQKAIARWPHDTEISLGAL